ncbi:hypothetical protein [Shewanella woodyi]|uniref:EstP n=1 Tax=Shewanella woodyi (strain ATCC 51908 / MS32) TaxID=392500 RepID=B1KQE1_SHEWM|nr:hypothetical protein [Shewanella woodyi]ACA84796.1 conserved hypothetical protein [Shewanella woodyi ATCC 51908]
MKAKFEVKYLDITWYDKNTVVSVTESFIPLKLEFEDTLKHFTCHTVIYPKTDGVKHGQLAFRALTKSSTAPYFERADGQRIPLKKVLDKDTGKTWWVEADVWLKDNKRWAGKSHRTAGNIKAYLSGQICQIVIGSSEFTAEQLNRYLSDFKSDLWELILDENSYVTGKAKKVQEGGISEESIQLVNNILSHAQNILKKPKSELREIQTLKPRKLVRPVNRTFMELATKGERKFLTSRATEPSYNVPENRYVLFALQRIHKILKQLVTISKSKVNRLENTVTKLNERLEAFSDVKQIDEELVLKDLKRMQSLSNAVDITNGLHKQLESINNNKPRQSTTYLWYLKLSKKTEDGSFFAGVKTNPNAPWFEYESVKETVILKFGNGSENYSPLFEPYFEYEVQANLANFSGISQRDTPYHTYTLLDLTSIKVIGGVGLQKRHDKYLAAKQQVDLIRNSGWRKQLTSQEKLEQDREKRSVQNQLETYSNQHLSVKLVYEQLEPKLHKFKVLLNQIEKLGVKPSSTFPNSMTFVQNIDYQAVHSGYKRIREQTNLTDEDLLLSLEKVEDIGLINMPLLYERWCLLQMIKVLVQNYHYQPTDDWKRRLLKIISTGRHSESMGFSNEVLKRDLKLRYEPVLANGRTPDFVMDVNFERKNGERFTKRFVMDAKFYSNGILKNNGGISSVVKHLYHEKNYSENGANAVFVLHPAKAAIEEKVSPQLWGQDSYLGELAMFDWDSSSRQLYHQYGAICANPILRLRYLDEFQRMIGMFLQYGIEENSLGGRPDDVESMNFCIACGSHQLTRKDTNTGNQRSAWYECDECKHFTVYNHCYSCNTRLIKNGDYWSYHSQMPMEPLNIKCPACESLL